MLIQQCNSITPECQRLNQFSLRMRFNKPLVDGLNTHDIRQRRIREIAPVEDMRRVGYEFQQASQLRGTGAQRDIVIEPAGVLDGLGLRDAGAGGDGRDIQGTEGASGNVREGAAGVRQDDVDVRDRADRARDDEVDGGARRVLRVVHDGLREEPADEPGRDVHVGGVHVHQRLVCLQLLPDGPEGRVAGEFPAVRGIDAHAAGEFLFRVEEIDLG